MNEDELNELDVPGIIRDRLKKAGIKTIESAKQWLQNPRGSALQPDQIEHLRSAISDWDQGIAKEYQD